MKTFVKAVMAGIAISIGGIVYLTLESHIIGAFLFTIGLFTIFTFELELFTGKVCYIPNKELGYLKDVLSALAGNTVGTVSMGYLLRHTKVSKVVGPTVELVDGKLSDTIFSTFVMAVLCGIMMCVAVIGYRTIKEGVIRYMALVVPIMVFILSGFEHSIADMFFYSIADAWGMKAVEYIIVIAVGNLIGGAFIPLASRYLDGKKLGCE